MYFDPECGSNAAPPDSFQSAAWSLANCGYVLLGRMLDVTRKLPVPRPLPPWFPALSAPFRSNVSPSSGPPGVPATGKMFPSWSWPPASERRYAPR